ncbi:hypothetical protein NHJ13051_009862 [Beauveria bassiana]
MFLFQPMLALLGFAWLAAGYSIAGSVERMYFYYAYKLDTLTPGNQVIAPGCKDCNLDQFIKHISKDKNIKVSISTEPFPEVVKDAKNNYASLLQKVGDRVVGKLSSSPNSPELAADFEKAKAGVYEAMKGVYNERMRAAVESFKPFPGEAEAFKVVEKEKGRGKSVDLEATVKANPIKTKAQIKAAWNKHIAGGHQENLSNFQKSITLAQELVCPAGSSRRMMKRQGLLCGETIIQDQLGGIKEVTPPPKGDEMAGPPKGEEVKPGKGEKTPSELGKSAKLAEEVSEKEFAELAAKRGLDTLAKEKWQMSLSDVRTKLKYEPLKPTSPKVGAGGFKAPSIGAGAVAVVGGALWVHGVVSAFTHNVTELDRAAAVTAIVPFVGCAVGTAAAAEKGDVDGLDSALCFLGDGLLLTPAFPVGIAIHVVRAIMSFFKPPKLPELADFQRQRDQTWARYLQDDISTYIYSHESYYEATGHPRRSKEKTFREKLESSLAMEKFAVISNGAQTIGHTEASAQDDLEAADSPESKAEMERVVQNATEQLHEAMSKEIVRRQRKLLIDMPKELKEKHDMSLQPTADQYNAEFIKNITTEQMVGKYRTIYPGDPEVPGSQRDDSGEIRAKLRGFGDKLRETPPALPRSHACSTARLPKTSFLQSPRPRMPKMPRNVQTLVALKLGRVYDELKFKWANRQFHGATAWFPDQQIKGVNKFLTQPQLHPVPVETEDFENTYTYVSLVTGLSDAIVATLKDNADALGRVQVVSVGQSITDLAECLKDMVGESDAHWAAAIEELRKKEAADGVVEVPPAKLKRTLARSSSGYRSEIAASMQ